MQSTYSRRSPAVKRLMKEAQELKDPTEQYFAQPLDDNLFEWHFTVRGPPDSDFSKGVYHGRITLPPEYPMKPPSIMLLTPTGRFEVGTKICLSISGHHPETWQPSWSIRTVLLAIIGFMPTKGEGAIGSLDYTPDERKVLARKSQEWKCEACGTPNRSILPPVTAKSAAMQKEAAELAAQIQFKKEEKKQSSTSESPSTPPAAEPAAAPANGQVPAPLPPHPFNMMNPGMGMGQMQPPFMPLPPNFMMPGQGQFGIPNHNPATPSQPAEVSSAQPQVAADTNSPDTPSGSNQSSASPPVSQSPPTTDSSNSDGVRQRTNVPSQSSSSSPPNQSTSGHTPHRPSEERGLQGIMCPLVTMSIFSFVIIVLIFRRVYLTYAYKFT
ncbi:ubiquitin-conjugating enzyme E2 J1-like [Lytechinus variegatus]|uniref:ubiquitin-conjugating enzyme E2 J1-like n=1 Tax=Lytechinus variegatus TaxID=7654 RepID=UPI001BB204D4|nr:ubiquitin-conjugating enzyme E2 J1-like [Lytechinus variegatus]